MAGNSSWYAYRKVFRRRIFWQQVGDSSRKFRWRLLDCNDVNFKLLLAGWLLFLGDSWTLAADPSLQLGVSQDIGDGGAMVVCHYPRDGTNPIDVLIHFHGAVAVAADNFTRSKRDGALIVINFNGLSAAYARPFQTSPALFDRVLDLAASQLGPETTWGQISLSSFSAGYGAVREILKVPENFNRIDGLLAADSMYASLEKEQERRRPLEEHMRDYARFAKLASEGKKTFVITHSSQETPYASTTETANYLLEWTDIRRQPESRLDGEKLMLVSV